MKPVLKIGYATIIFKCSSILEDKAYFVLILFFMVGSTLNNKQQHLIQVFRIAYSVIVNLKIREMRANP